MCALPQTVLPPTAGPEYPASTFSFLDGDFDLAQELEAIESMKLDSVNNELDAAMDFWGASPEVTMKTESMDMQVFGGLEDMGSIAPQEIFWSEDMSTMPAITIPKDPQPMPIVQQAPPPVAPVVKNTRANPYVHKACVHCKASHVACNNARPCQRCVRSGKADTCVDSERKKRGRPGSSATSSCAADHVDNQATSSSSRPKKRSKPSPPPTLSASVSPTATPAMSTTTEADFAQLFDMPAGNMQGLVPLNLEQSSDLFLDQNLMQQQFNTPEALEAAVVAAAQAMLGGLQQQPQLPENLFAMDDASQQFTFGYTHNLLG
ncbi:uncharacterized protein EV422DRAFT_414883 [Fimicolochytrium jonesii]|uniref:uncharacterized protein n=1 Tax=Fimicolochytrium jonesii TaxID=1396493 RepID=UPI0022FF25B6|nr:uncharacterized protein EV422DRAFT_414883 [Fimicolochytrium jonesii]KAI8822051.1 hypothetical protein EV422DRAFT_414883 [Fimicolochytrium jonesii]